MGFKTLKEDLIGYKKCRNGGQQFIVTLLIPKGTRIHVQDNEPDRYSVKANKHLYKRRAQFAYVLSVVNVHNDLRKECEFQAVILHRHGRNYQTGSNYLDYRVGEIVLPHKFSRINEPCAGGIHFFVDHRHAVRWN